MNKLYDRIDAFITFATLGMSFIQRANLAIAAASLTALIAFIGLLHDAASNQALSVLLDKNFGSLQRGAMFAAAGWAIANDRLERSADPKPHRWLVLIELAMTILPFYLAFSSFDALMMTGVDVRIYLKMLPFTP